MPNPTQIPPTPAEPTEDPKPDFNNPHTPWHGRASFDCPHCGSFAGHIWFTMLRQEGLHYKQGGTLELASDRRTSVPSPRGSESVRWTQAQCAFCKKFHTWHGNTLIFPAKNVLPLANPDMPESVQDLYNEARDVAAVSKRAGAAMARSTLEALLREVLPDADRKTALAGLIDLASETVSSGLDQLLTYIRHVGNASVHVDEIPDQATVLVLDENSNEAMGAIFEAMNDLVDEMITKPKKTAALTGATPEEVLKGVRERRAKRERRTE